MSEYVAAAAEALSEAVTRDNVALATAQRDIAARLERLPITRTHTKARFVVGSATFFDGFDALSIAFVMPVLVGLWSLTPGQTGLLISGAYVGQILGAAFFPWASDKMGRLWSTAWAAGLFGLASLLCAACWNMPSLLIARFIQGCGLGGEVPVGATYINEIARAPTRGKFFLLYEMAFAIGYLGAASVALWVVPHIGWQAMFLIGGCPAFIAAVMQRLVPESPRWLASRGRVAEADAIVSRMEGEAEAKLGHKLPAPELGRVPPINPKKMRLAELFQGVYAKRTGVVWTMWFCQFFTTQSINAWLPTLYKTQLHLTTQQALLYAFFNHGLGILSAFTVAMLLDRMGRRLWFSLAWPLGALPLFVLAFIGVGNPLLVVVLATASSFCLSTCSVSLYVYTPELYPTRMRGFATGTAATVRNIGASIGPTLLGFVLAGYGIRSVFLLFAIVPVIAATVVAVFGIETKGRVLEEISP
jgi:putative MFS transporter